MSSLRAALMGSGLSSAVKNGSGMGGGGVQVQKYWLSSYSLNRQYHSYQYRQLTTPVITTGKMENNGKGMMTMTPGKHWQWPSVSAGIHSSAVNFRTEARIDESLNRLDTEIRRVGRIRRQEVDDILMDIKEMKKATSSQSLMIIRCCGELIPEEPPSSRTELVQQVWKTLETLKVPMDISHYNALLRVYLENEHPFSPTAFLDTLTSAGLEPNRVTYQRLIARFCQSGDIDGASTILQHMKEKQMPINEYVFNALILGHGQCNDMTSAEGILSVMKQAGLEPNDDTYVTLMTCYAKQGDIQNVHRLVKECEEKEIFLIDRDFLSVIYNLAANNQAALIDEVIPYLKKHSGYNQEATSLIFRLVNINQDEVAYQILKTMTPLTRTGQDGTAKSIASGNFFIKQLVQLNRGSEVIVQICKRLETEGLNKWALSRACEFALIAKKWDLAMELMEAGKDGGLAVRQHYFWPFFAGAETEKEVIRGIRNMREMGLTPSLETLREYVVPKVLEMGKGEVAHALDKLSDGTGIPKGNLVGAGMMYLLGQSNLKMAAEFVREYRVRVGVGGGAGGIRRNVVECYVRSRDVDSFVKIIGAGVEGDGREEVGGMLMELVDYIRSPERKAELLEPVLEKLLEQGLGLSNSGSELLQNQLGEALTPRLAEKIGELTSGDLQFKREEIREGRRAVGGTMQFEDKSTEEMEELLEEAKRRGGVGVKSLKKSLLYSYCRDKQVEKLDQLKKELEGEEFVFSSGMHAMFMDLYAGVGRLEEATLSYEEILKGLDMKMDDMKILRYSGALIEAGKVDEGINVLKTAPRDEGRKPAVGGQQILVWRMLNSLAEKEGPEKVREVLELLKERGLSLVNNVTLGPLIKAWLNKDDLEGALKEFERCVEEYRVTPWKSELFCRFIKMEDADRLQRVMDLSTGIHGEVNSMYDLVFAFIDCGKVRQARKILETPGLRARNDKIEQVCQKYCQDGRVEELEKLMEATRDLGDVDRGSMYFYLVQAYCKQGEEDKALSVWTTMQEENVQPSVELLIYLADFLRKKGREVPFVVPERSEMMGGGGEGVEVKEVRKGDVSLPKSLVEFRRCIEMGEVDKALQIKQRMDSEGSSLNVTDCSNLILGLAQAERLNEASRLGDELLEKDIHPLPKTLRFLMGRLANAGDVNTLERMGEKLSEDLKRYVMLNSRICLAYVNADRGVEYFEGVLKKKVVEGGGEAVGQSGGAGEGEEEELGNVPVQGVVTLLNKNEELIGEFEQLANAARGSQQRALRNALYVHYMLKREFGMANEVWENSLKSEERLLFRVISLEARRNKDVELANKIAEHVLEADKLKSRAKAVASSCYLDVLREIGELGKALEHLNGVLSSDKLTLEDYPVGVLQRLKDSAAEKGVEFPYQVPQQRAGTRNRDLD